MSDTHEIKMMTPATRGLIAVMALGMAFTLYRMARGLGAATNLNDNVPWGLWIGFDVLGGVAMAAGGFVIATIVYLLNIKKYKPVARAAILTAFLGYLLAIAALFIDIGQPLRIWHPAVMWQVRSVMFIVAIHVILYTTVLALESSPLFFERFGMDRAKRIIERIMIPIVIFGVLLSTLHQSSLGALYLIVPGKLSPLWYGPSLPFLFLVSAVMMGLAMVSFESILSSRMFNHPTEKDILSGLARISLFVILFYFAAKLYVLAKGPGLGAAFDGSLEGNLYLLELLAGVVAPLALLLWPGMRTNVNGIYTVNILVIAGVILNRMNVAVFGMIKYTKSIGGSYFPSLGEVVITLGMVAFGILVFKTAVKYLKVLSS